jgi:colicin import membrane protein
MREKMQASADAAAEAREAADEALAQAARAERAAQETAAAQAEEARDAAGRQAAAAAEAQQQADAAVEAAPPVDECPAGPGEEAAACWAQREGLTLTCPETDHWVRSLDECTPEALFGPDWEELVDQ